MSNKQFDITVFGATGLTGKQIVRHLYQLSQEHPSLYPSQFKWAIAGRSEDKLQAVLDEIVSQYPESTLSKPTILTAAVTQRDRLDAITSQTKVLINASKDAIMLMLLASEPEFVERMQRTYHDKAVTNHTSIVHCCGFDSVPSDLGVLYTKNLYAERGWTPTQIEMFLRIHVGEAVHGFGSAELLREIRKASNLKKLEYVGQRLTFHKGVTKDREFGYHVPFIFADPSVVRLSQQIFATGLVQDKTDRPAPPTTQFAAYLLLPSLWAVILYVIYGYIFSFLATIHWGRQLLLKHPEFFSAGLFSKEHPTQTQLDQASFEVILRSKGYEGAISVSEPPNRSMKVVVRGPEAGYVATPRIVIQCALVMLLQKERVPPGVLTPSTAFWQTDLIQRLGYVGITFDISN
ncbi:hypothetical protein G6F70_001190 [Rhizopus microsporus]|nr:hypothetical protein G6F71_004385 [Rhizopus microsporus]KAG1203671.1 hypothetical protein G6F70_001190 [Rhizopus microsporus]KAG1211703.1 hypothetical protein G6F69_004360 [Rhizopus microsporus]KAG1233943.1 hypothetical protein G6F67_003902 [Rhizopus microsporus]KAG1265730.1 hypothetical protein G6F68_003342 [Rhizopus microsporus]